MRYTAMCWHLTVIKAGRKTGTPWSLGLIHRGSKNVTSWVSGVACWSWRNVFTTGAAAHTASVGNPCAQARMHMNGALRFDHGHRRVENLRHHITSVPETRKVIS